MSPAHSRAVMTWARDADCVSERRVCRALRVHRALVRYASVKLDDAPVHRPLHELARDHPSFGAKRLHTMLRRDGLPINHKTMHRLYVKEGLQLKVRRQRRRAASVRQLRAAMSWPHERWPSAAPVARDEHLSSAPPNALTDSAFWKGPTSPSCYHRLA